MADENKSAKAKQVYNTLCSSLEHRNWTFQREDEKLLVHFNVTGDDLPIQLIIFVDEKRQLIRLMSQMYSKMSEDKRMEGVLACCAANYGMVDGSFDYDISDGGIRFRMNVSYAESVLGEGLFRYLIDCACATIDKYNSKFFAVNKGLMSITDFLKGEE